MNLKTRPVNGLPKRPLPMKAWWEGSEMVEWENWARNQLMAAGSDLLGKFCSLQVYILPVLKPVLQIYKIMLIFLLVAALPFAFHF